MKQTNQIEKVKDKMITLNKSIIILPHEEMIKKLEETKIQRMIQFRNLNQYMGSDSTNSNFTKDENGRPTLELKELEETAIHTPTQESYDLLMQIYECGNWKWRNGDLPSDFNFWINYEKQTCIQACNRFEFASKRYYENHRKIITTQEFCKFQDPQIRNMTIKEINKWFETNKPNRKSKR